jgi:hypothetical protein
MHGCPRCKELSESLEKLVVKYWVAVDNNKRLAATDPDKPDAEMVEHATRTAMEDARKVLEDHMKGAHPHVVGSEYKGRPTSHSIKTQRPSLPIISSLEALSARRRFHPRTPVRSFNGPLTACPLESGATARHSCQVPCVHLRAAFNLQAASQEASFLLPEMILRLCWRIVNPKRQMKPSMAAYSEIPIRLFRPLVSSSGFMQEWKSPGKKFVSKVTLVS